MNREQLLSHLVKLRELELLGHSSELKTTASALATLRADTAKARETVGDSIDSGHLDDLAHLGAMRLRWTRLASGVEQQVVTLSNKVSQARKLADSARAARHAIRRNRDAARDRSQETEAEHFFSWHKNRKSER